MKQNVLKSLVLMCGLHDDLKASQYVVKVTHGSVAGPARSDQRYTFFKCRSISGPLISTGIGPQWYHMGVRIKNSRYRISITSIL